MPAIRGKKNLVADATDSDQQPHCCEKRASLVGMLHNNNNNNNNNMRYEAGAQFVRST